jgi:ribosomal protein S18 acetylase RimI-like enzyme
MVAKPPEMDDFATIPGVSAVGDVSVVGDVAVVGDAYLRWRAAGELTDPVLVEDGHVAWCWERDHDAPDGQAWATVVGDDPAVAAALIDRLARLRAFDGVTVRESVVPGLPQRLHPQQPGRWCAWTLDVAEVTWPADPVVVDLDRRDPRIDPLLDHSASAYVRTDDPLVDHWVGVDDGGMLVAVGASHREVSGAAHVVSVCTHPDRRGQGLAKRVVRSLAQRAQTDGAPVVYLEMFADNEAARRVYRRVGFTEHATYVSGSVPRSA